MLTKTRVEVLRAANQLDDSVDMTQVEQQSRDSYSGCLQTKDHMAYLVFHKDNFVGAGGISFFRVFRNCLCRRWRHVWKCESNALSTIEFESAEADMGYKHVDS